MADIINNILKQLPESTVQDATFEGANIVLYTKDKDFFLESEDKIRAVVEKIKKRVELRASEEILTDKEKTEKIIKLLISVGQDRHIC